MPEQDGVSGKLSTTASLWEQHREIIRELRTSADEIFDVMSDLEETER